MNLREVDISKLLSILNEVNKDNLMRDTHEISRWIRITGSEEEEKAFDYIKTRCEEVKASITEYKPVIFSSVPVEAQLLVELPEGGTRNIPCITHSMSPSTPPTGITGKLILYEELSLNERENRFALVRGIANPKALLDATLKGASACIFLADTDPPPEMIVSPVWGSPNLEDLKKLPQIPTISVGFNHAQELLSYAKRGLTAKIFTKVKTKWTKTNCIVAEIKPDSEAESELFILLSGHVDSWYHGAMDNASGNACQLEILRIASLHRKELQRSLKVAFWSGHSHGRYGGSTWYSDQNYLDLLSNCIVHINADCLGAKGASVVTEGNIMEETRFVGERVIEIVCGQKLIGNRFTRMGDQSFWGCGVPSLLVTPAEQPPSTKGATSMLLGRKRTGGLGPWWHTPLDTIDIIDPENLVRDTKIILGATWWFLTAPLIPLIPLSAVIEISNYIDEYAKRWQRVCPGEEDMQISSAIEIALELSIKLKNRLHEAETYLEKLEASTLKKRLPYINRKILDIERILVRLNYCSGPFYFHDPATPEPPMPILLEPERLEYLSDIDQKMAFLVELRRRLNGVHEMLWMALIATESLISELKS
ncbi:MAG: M28 family peptidase [Synergistetes bacterium]|nr:M28 family peptidase [Synergistota bacterium]MDW8192901.1 M28 family peptidase [Synergistota bacterium]